MFLSTLYVLRIFSRNLAEKLMFNLFPSLVLLIGLPIINNSISMWIANDILVVPEEFTHYSLGFQCLIILPVCTYCLIKLNLAIGEKIK